MPVQHPEKKAKKYLLKNDCHHMKTKLFKYLVGYIITTFEITIDADKAATDPPPGLGDLAPTVNTKSFTSI